MVRKNQIVLSLISEEEYNEPVRTESIVPPVVPIVSVKSVNGMTGDVVLKTLKVGDKTYNGEGDITIEMNDLVPGGAVAVYRGAGEETDLPKPTEFKKGDLYLNITSNEFWFGADIGTVRKIPTKDFLAPYAKIASTASEIVLNFVDQDHAHTLIAQLKNGSGEIISTATQHLPIEKLITDITYDHATRSLIFWFEDGTTKTVALTELVDSLLEKITLTNKLKSELVEGLDEFKAATNTALTTETATRETADTNLSNRITEETTARTNADQTLTTSITDEAATRKTADDKLTADVAINKDAISVETMRAKDREDAIAVTVTEESNRAKGVEEGLTTTTNAHGLRLTTIENESIPGLRTDLTTEIAERKSKDESVDTEIVGLKAADTALDTRITSIEVKETSWNSKYDKPAAGIPKTDLAADVQESLIKANASATNADLTAEISRAKAKENQIIADYIAADDIVRTEFKLVDDQIKARVKVLEDADFGGQISTEQNRAQLAEQTNATAIDNEITRATGAEGTLTTALTQEVTRATNAEATLQNNKLDVMPGDVYTSGNAYNLPYYFRTAADANKVTVTAETVTLDGNKTHGSYSLDVKAATQSTAGLMSAADKYKLDNTVSESGLADEIARAKAREDAIEAAYKLADDGLSDRIDAIHVAEYTLVKDPDSATYAAVYHLTKDGVNVGADINIPKDQMLKAVNTGTCVTENVPEGFHVGEHYIELVFDTASGEVKRYIKVEDIIKPYSGSATITIDDNNVISLNADLKTKIDNTATGLSAESTTRELNDNALNTIIANEITRASNKETDLQHQIDELDDGLQEEKTRAVQAESTLTTNLSNEVSRATTAENNISTDLTSEVNRATAAENTLTTNLNTEVSTARANEATLQANIDQEVIDRNNAISTAIDALDASYTIEAGKVITSIVESNGKITEVGTDTLTIAKVDLLQTKLDALSARIKAFEDLNLVFTDATM